jgi:hypothetical protein
MAFSNWSSIRQKVAVVNKQSQGNQPGSPGQTMATTGSGGNLAS